MIVLGGVLLLGAAVVHAKKSGASAGKIALLIVFGTVGIVIATFGILAWGFAGFG